MESKFKIILSDAEAVISRDPATSSKTEAFLLSSGLHAIAFYRLNHWLWNKNWKIMARFLSLVVRFFTGIEIHPAARIGKSFFIDHGMGVVIGETTIIGDDVLIYQGVTLGGTGKEQGKRHPTLGNFVTVGAGAKILGNITIGDYSTIGAGSVVIENVAEHCTVVGIPGRIVKQTKYIEGQLQHNRIPDPVACEMNRLKYEVLELKEKLEELNKK